MAHQHYQGPTCPVIDSDPQVLMYLWFHYTASPEQRAAAIAATTPKPDKEPADDAKITQ